MTSRALALALLILTLSACTPGDDDLRAMGATRRGPTARTVPMGLIVPATTAQAACCPNDPRWFDLATPPTTGDVYPDAQPGDRYFRGGSALKPDCMVEAGLLVAAEVRHGTVTCAEVSCTPGASTAFTIGTATVQVPTPALKALIETDKTTSVELAVGRDRLGPILTRERLSWSELSITFALLEDPTDLTPCVLEDHSRAPGPNRKVTYPFKRTAGKWE